MTAAEYVVGKTKTAPNPHVSREPAEFDAEVFLRALRKLKRAINREASPYQIAKLEVVIDNLLA